MILHVAFGGGGGRGTYKDDKRLGTVAQVIMKMKSLAFCEKKVIVSYS